MTRASLPLLALASLALFTACPPTGVVCKPGTLPCGNGCIDPTADVRNCGACGAACFAQQSCNNGTCECRAGSSACGSECVVLAYDAKHCGSCDRVCAAGQVCNEGTCQNDCDPGLTRCATSCVNTASDVGHCGACGVACSQGQTCVNGACDYPVVAACYWSGHLVGFDPATGAKGPLSDVGTNPATLARLGSALVVADQTDRRLYSALPSPQGAYQLGAQATVTGAVTNQVLVDRPWVYLANAGSGTVQVLKEGADAGVLTFDAGAAGALQLGTVAELQLGMNTYPQGLVKVGNTLWVPLYGGLGAAAADAGQVLVKVDVTSPDAPALAGQVSLKGLDLKAFDGGAPVARPWAITAKGTTVYVALNNLNPDTYAPEGPGLVAKVDTSTDQVSALDLGADDCLNPQWLGFVGEALVVSCGGAITYDANYAVESVTAAGVVAVTESGARLGVWRSAGRLDVDAGVVPVLPGRFTVSNGALVLSDQNGGRAVVLAVGDAGVTEVRAGASALSVCPTSETTGVANVADLVSR